MFQATEPGSPVARRETHTTSWPAWRSRRRISVPTTPVAPVIRIWIMCVPSCRDLGPVKGETTELAAEKQQGVVIGRPAQGQEFADEDRVVAAVIAAPELAFECGHGATDQRHAGQSTGQAVNGLELA